MMKKSIIRPDNSIITSRIAQVRDLEHEGAKRATETKHLGEIIGTTNAQKLRILYGLMGFLPQDRDWKEREEEERKEKEKEEAERKKKEEERKKRIENGEDPKTPKKTKEQLKEGLSPCKKCGVVHTPKTDEEKKAEKEKKKKEGSTPGEAKVGEIN
jgi:hypothetical protein